MYCCRFGVLLNAHFVSSTIAWSIKLIGKFIPKDKYSLCPFISGVLTYSPLPVGGIEIQQIILLPFVNLNSLPFASGLNPASLVCLSSSLLVDKRSTSTTNLKQPPEAGMSKRLSSSSATLLKSPDKRKSPRLPPSPPSSLLPSYPVLQLNQQKCFVFVCVCVWEYLWMSFFRYCTISEMEQTEWTLTPLLFHIQGLTDSLMQRGIGKTALICFSFLIPDTAQFFCIHSLHLFGFINQ